MSGEPRLPDRGASDAPTPHARIESPSEEVERPASSARVPGAPKNGYTRLPTGPVGVEPVIASGPAEGPIAPGSGWTPSDAGSVPETLPSEDTRLAPWALGAAIIALAGSFFVGWVIPVAVVSVIAAVMSLRRPVESRAIGRWALVLGLCATVYSLGWLVWAGMQFERIV